MMIRVSDVPSRWAQDAVGHIAERSSGRPVDRSLRVTRNFHPDRAVDGVTVLSGR
jgi:hypothetical protein